MYLKVKNQEQLIREAIEKAGSYRKLSKEIKIPRSTLTGYIKSEAIPEDKFNSIIRYLGIKYHDSLISGKLPDNWRQVKGGKGLIELKKKNGTFNEEMKKWQDFQAKKLKKWHKFMKDNRPEEYYNIQYSRFKKIFGYKFITNNGEKVRNSWEKQIADALFKLKINYKYEPLVHIGKKYFFPDFLINNKIALEVTVWKGEEKAYKLKEKIRYLSKKYKVYVVIPKTLYSYYQILNHHLILGLDEFVPIAQTFVK